MFVGKAASVRSHSRFRWLLYIILDMVIVIVSHCHGYSCNYTNSYNHTDMDSINPQQHGLIKSLLITQQPRFEGFINHGRLNTHDIINHNQLS
jgi:hypothetical protein